MKGTSFSVTRAMDLMPPMMTIPTATAKQRPMSQLSPAIGLSAPPVTAWIWAVAWLAWNMLPPPSAPPMQKIAKRMARVLPKPALPVTAPTPRCR